MTGKSLKLEASAQYLGIKQRTFYNMLKDKRFPVVPIPGTKPRLWSVADLDAWLAGTYQAPVAE